MELFYVRISRWASARGDPWFYLLAAIVGGIGTRLVRPWLLPTLQGRCDIARSSKGPRLNIALNLSHFNIDYHGSMRERIGRWGASEKKRNQECLWPGGGSWGMWIFAAIPVVAYIIYVSYVIGLDVKLERANYLRSIRLLLVSTKEKAEKSKERRCKRLGSLSFSFFRSSIPFQNIF